VCLFVCLFACFFACFFVGKCLTQASALPRKVPLRANVVLGMHSLGGRTLCLSSPRAEKNCCAPTRRPRSSLDFQPLDKKLNQQYVRASDPLSWTCSRPKRRTKQIWTGTCCCAWACGFKTSAVFDLRSTGASSYLIRIAITLLDVSSEPFPDQLVKWLFVCFLLVCS
jgi:hypothetical protein